MIKTVLLALYFGMYTPQETSEKVRHGSTDCVGSSCYNLVHDGGRERERERERERKRETKKERERTIESGLYT